MQPKKKNSSKISRKADRDLQNIIKLREGMPQPGSMQIEEGYWDHPSRRRFKKEIV